MSTIDTIQSQSESRRTPYGGGLRRAGRLLESVFNWLEVKAQKRRSRRALLEMTDEQLKDIGISRADAYKEGLRPFWD